MPPVGHIYVVPNHFTPVRRNRYKGSAVEWWVLSQKETREAVHAGKRGCTHSVDGLWSLSILTNGRSIQKNYKEIALTATVKHNSKISKVSQFFLKEGPLAILPFSKNMFSVVWSVSNIFFQKYNKSLKKILNEKIKILLYNAEIKKIENIQQFPIRLNLKTKYFKRNVLILGAGFHAVHPMAGQGFNLVLRDIKKLSELISSALKLGLSLKNSFLLKDFYHSRKPENTILGLGIDLTNIFFKDNKYFFPMKKIILSSIYKFKFIKKISQIISDKGITV